MPVFDVILVDGVPRKHEQVEWVFQNYLTNKKYDVSFLYITCDQEKRDMRLINRDKSISSQKLSNERLKTEIIQNYFTMIKLFDLCTDLLGGEYYFKVFDNSSDKSGLNSLNWNYFLSEYRNVPVQDSIDGMLLSNNEFSDITFEKSNVPTSMGELFNSARGENMISPYGKNATWISNFLIRAIEELNEALQELPNAWKPGAEIKLDRIRVELIDAWHFILSAITATGMDSEMFIRTYHEKRRVNLKRWVNSTTRLKKSKGDDNHIGKF